MLYNDTTWNRLNRFFNIFHPRVYKYLLITNGILLAWCIYNCYAGAYAIPEMLCVIVLTNGILLPNLLLHCPKKLFLYKAVAEFEDYVSMRPKRIMSTNFWWLKVSYIVEEITEIEFRQNAFERLFDVGRISFSGKTTFTAKRDMDAITVKQPFILCGIRNFTEFRATHSAYQRDL